MTKSDGGPAFPIEMTGTPYAPGMSLRDWFAGQALAGIMTNPVGGEQISVANKAYRIADAMLAARDAIMEGRKDG